MALLSALAFKLILVQVCAALLIAAGSLLVRMLR